MAQPIALLRAAHLFQHGKTLQVLADVPAQGLEDGLLHHLALEEFRLPVRPQLSLEW